MAPYASGNRGLWLKAKALSRQEFVVVGWSEQGADHSDGDFQVKGGREVKATPQVGEHLDEHSGAYATGGDELAVIGEVPEQQHA